VPFCVIGRFSEPALASLPPAELAIALPASDPEPVFVGRDGVKPRAATAERRLGLDAGTPDASTIDHRVETTCGSCCAILSWPMGDRVAKSRTGGESPAAQPQRRSSFAASMGALRLRFVHPSVRRL
jgi:hypothetical protein